jgi:hypothetical protein
MLTVLLVNGTHVLADTDDKNSNINRINETLKSFDEWTAASIDERQLMLIELAKDVWKTLLISAT